MLFKLITIGIVVGGGVYFYDLKKSETELQDARFVIVEAGEDRCKRTHESMCKYNMTVKLGDGKDSKFYKFRVPWNYFHQRQEELKEERFTLIVKKKKILPERILGLEPKYRQELDEAIAASEKI